MSQSIKKDKTEKQKKSLRKIVDKLYKKDLEEILNSFFAPKKGTKEVLRRRVNDFIETDKNDIDFAKLKKEIKRVYKSNPKIKKSPKKGKSPLKKKTKIELTPEKIQEELHQIKKLINECRKDREDESDDQSSHSDLNLNPVSVPIVPILNVNPFLAPNVTQTVNSNDNYETLSNNRNQPFQSTAGSSNIPFDPWFAREKPAQYAQPAQPPPTSATNMNTSMTFSLPQRSFSASNLLNPLTTIFSNNNFNQNNAYSFGGGVRPPAPIPPPNLFQNSVQNTQLIRPITNPFNGSAQPINYSINNYYQSSSQNFIQQNIFHNQMLDDFNPQSFDSLIEQQKFLLSQYPKSFQDTDKSSSDSDGPLTDFVFKCLPKFKVFKALKETKTIGSLTDIGSQVVFDIKPTDLEPTYLECNMTDDLKTLLDRKCLKIQLRFTYVADVNLREQKDSLPEYLCIECNNQRIFTFEEDSENMSGPFDLSDYCNFDQNKVKFSVNKANYTFLMPCIYEISIVTFDTCDTFLSKLKQNMFQFLTSETTKQLIRSRSDQITQDEIISINTETKLKLICPLSCRRIETPCRTSECKHIECFDAHSFFKTNELRYDWFCPICQKSAHFDKLRIDGYVAEVLHTTEDNITEIFIKPDGNYDIIKTETETKKDFIIIELDDSIADSDDIECSVIDADGCIVLD